MSKVLVSFSHPWRKIYSTELQTSANKAALRTLEEETEVLREKISQAAQDKERLYAKYQKIQDFHTLTVSAGKLRTIPVSDEMAYHKILKKKKIGV